MAAIPPHPAGTTLAAIRARRPLVHCLTNPVAANLTANALACLGASPLMAEAAAEMEAVSRFTDALLVNLGMQHPARMEAAEIATSYAQQFGRPWVLDPVAAGAIAVRMTLAKTMVTRGPRLIKGNASEIRAMADAVASGRGTDSTDDAADVVESARRLAYETGATVAITAAIDWITDGERTLAVHRGHPWMAKVSGMGCVAGAVAAACLAVEPDALIATEHALTLLGVAGELAAKQSTGPASFAAALLDALHGLDPAMDALRA